MRTWVLQHVPYETPQRLEGELKKLGHTLHLTRLYAGDPFPSPGDLDLLLIMGGPMGTYEEHLYPWMRAEKEFIRSLISLGKPILGICLGAQLLAEALGGRVYPHTQKEIGWFPVELTSEGRNSPLFSGFPSTFTVFHWHGDTFTLPPDTLHLVQTPGCPHQAFASRNLRWVGLQFHLEMTAKGITDLLSNSPPLPNGQFVQQPKEMIADIPKYLRDNEQYLRRFLYNFLSLEVSS